MSLTKVEFERFAKFLDNLPEFGVNAEGYTLIEYATVRAHLDHYFPYDEYIKEASHENTK